eukprot:snap_masked-scaffold_8-processed-gene-0.16-mRNA-1 protein AED:1.00 eAED:1.00 QI:0/0/0/0/1/1/3/0/144
MFIRIKALNSRTKETLDSVSEKEVTTYLAARIHRKRMSKLSENTDRAQQNMLYVEGAMFLRQPEFFFSEKPKKISERFREGYFWDSFKNSAEQLILDKKNIRSIINRNIHPRFNTLFNNHVCKTENKHGDSHNPEIEVKSIKSE